MPRGIREDYRFNSCVKRTSGGREVYFVKRIADGQKAVLRISDAAFDEDVARESEILARLDNAAIPKILGAWQQNGRSYLVREYFAGTPLNEFVRAHGQLKLGQIIDIAVQLCDILDYLHRQSPPVIHRDIKPENIIVAADGEIKLIDFGIARHFQQNAAHDTEVVGTRPYMAPEQFGSEQTDARADIYSLGVVMIYLATKKTDKADLENTYPYKQLASVIEKCIQKDRGRRFNSVAKLKKRLLRIKNHTVKKALLGAAAAVCVCAAFVGGFFAGRYQGFNEGVDSLLSAPGQTKERFDESRRYEPVSFSDWYLDMAVRNALGKQEQDTIYYSEVYYQIDALDIYGTFVLHPGLDTALIKQHVEAGHVVYWTDSGFLISARGDIDSLADVSDFYYLRELRLTSQSISELGPLEGLKLEVLDVSNNFVGNLMPLKDMATLRELSVCENPVENIAPLSRLLSLERLDISQTQVGDLTPLKPLTKLQQLELNYCEVSDLSPLGGLTKLRVLGMRGVSPNNYRFLNGMAQLASLDIGDSGFKDLSKLPALPALETLALADNPLSSLRGLSKYQSLSALDLSGTDIVDIGELGELQNLRALDLSDTAVSDLSALAGLSGLKELDISGTYVTDLSPLLGQTEPLRLTCKGISESALSTVKNDPNIIIVNEWE